MVSTASDFEFEVVSVVVWAASAFDAVDIVLVTSAFVSASTLGIALDLLAELFGFGLRP